jgi:hypothetical protein
VYFVQFRYRCLPVSLYRDKKVVGVFVRFSLRRFIEAARILESFSLPGRKSSDGAVTPDGESSGQSPLPTTVNAQRAPAGLQRGLLRLRCRVHAHRGPKVVVFARRCVNVFKLFRGGCRCTGPVYLRDMAQGRAAGFSVSSGKNSDGSGNQAEHAGPEFRLDAGLARARSIGN